MNKPNQIVNRKEDGIKEKEQGIMEGIVVDIMEPMTNSIRVSGYGCSAVVETKSPALAEIKEVAYESRESLYRILDAVEKMLRDDYPDFKYIQVTGRLEEQLIDDLFKHGSEIKPVNGDEECYFGILKR